MLTATLTKCLIPTFLEVILVAGKPTLKQRPMEFAPKEVIGLLPNIHAGCKRAYPKQPNICAVQIRYNPENGPLGVLCD